MRSLVLFVLCSSVAWATSLTPEQTAWLNTVYANLHQSSPSAQVQQVWTRLVGTGMIDVDDLVPPAFGGGGGAGQLSKEACDLIAAGIKEKAEECGRDYSALQDCEDAATTMGQDPAVMCQAIQSRLQACHTALLNLTIDWNDECYEP